MGGLNGGARPGGMSGVREVGRVLARLRRQVGWLLAAALVVGLIGAGCALAAKPRRADLVVRSAVAKLAGDRMTVSLVGANRGRRRAGTSTGSVSWKPAAGGSVVRLRVFSLKAVAARARRPVTVSVAVPAGAAGAFAVSVCLDVRSKVRESSGKNNCRSAGTVTVQPAAPPTAPKLTSSVPLATAPVSGPASPAPADTGAPDTSISRGPAGVTKSRSETFLFTASETGVTFQCRLDGGAWDACTTPKVLSSLADGPHTFEVRATDAAGDTDATPASRSWTVDATAPETSITSGPSGSSGGSPRFEFSSSEGGGSFECRLDGVVTWNACTTPRDLSSLAAGVHTFQVRAIDAVGNTDATPASRTWTVDLTAPQTTILSGPSGVVTGPSVAFEFSSEAGASFECRLDGGAWGACASPAGYSGLTDGSHTFDARAVDGAGNADLSPETRTWTVDAVAPETTIDSGPSGTVTSPDAVFGFSSSETGSTFECRLDAGDWAPCVAPASYASVAVGSHTFDVRATDGAGNVDETPASQAWEVSA